MPKTSQNWFIMEIKNAAPCILKILQNELSYMCNINGSLLFWLFSNEKGAPNVQATWFECVKCRCVFRTLPNIHDGAFCENN